MNRRGFLGTILAAAIAPAIVRADSLMRIVPRNALFLDADLQIGHIVGNLADELLGNLIPAPLIRASHMVEQDTIDVTTLLSGAKRYTHGITYHAAEVEMLLPSGVDMNVVYADGRPLLIKELSHTIMMPSAGRASLRLDNLPLEQFGNRIPKFQFRKTRL